MLVLTRKSNQSIMIGDEIEVSVLSVAGDKVRIGVEAPLAVPVYRTEVYIEIDHDRRRGLQAGRSRGAPRRGRKRVGARVDEVLGSLSAGG